MAIIKVADLGISSGVNTPSFSAKLTSNQTFTGSTEVKVQANLENWDTDGAYDTSNYRFTVPTGKAGKYLIIGAGKFSGVPANEYARIRYYLNGSSDLFGEVRIHLAYAGDIMFKAPHIFDLSDGDYVEMYIRSDDTGTNTMLHQGTHFSGFKLIGV